MNIILQKEPAFKFQLPLMCLEVQSKPFIHFLPPLLLRKIDRNNVFLDQKYTSYVNIHLRPKANHNVGQSFNLKILNSKAANQESRIPNNESFLQ